MISIYKCLFEEQQVFLKRKYGKYPAITVPDNVSKRSLKMIKNLYANPKVAADSKVVEKEHLDKS